MAQAGAFQGREEDISCPEVKTNAMGIRRALFCACAGWALAVRGQEPSGRADVAVPPAHDATNVSEYLQEKFRLAPPPGPGDVVAADGQVYRNVQVWKAEPDGLTLRHDEGLTKLEFPQLPEEWRRKYGYDPEAAAAYRRAVADALREAERIQQTLREQMGSAPP